MGISCPVWVIRPMGMCVCCGLRKAIFRACYWLGSFGLLSSGRVGALEFVHRAWTRRLGLELA